MPSGAEPPSGRGLIGGEPRSGHAREYVWCRTGVAHGDLRYGTDRNPRGLTIQGDSLAQLSRASHRIALGNPRIEEREARRLGITDRLEARVADMRCLDFADGSFDLIWCEGAIYNVGVEAGLCDWRRLLRREGHVALTEVCWRKPGAPAECAAFWNREYPAIRDTSALLEAVEACGYETVGHFPLPASAWWDDYYRPLQDNVSAFLKRHRDAPDAQELADRCQHEIDIWHACSEFYGYEFLVLRVR